MRTGLTADDHVRRLRTLLALLRLVLNLRPLGQRLVALPLDRREMNEQVLTAIGRRYEPVPLIAVEPLHSSGCHDKHPLSPPTERAKGGAQRATVTRSNSTPAYPADRKPA